MLMPSLFVFLGMTVALKSQQDWQYETCESVSESAASDSSVLHQETAFTHLQLQVRSCTVI